jgi:hypothetical protein
VRERDPLDLLLERQPLLVVARDRQPLAELADLGPPCRACDLRRERLARLQLDDPVADLDRRSARRAR